MKTDIKISRGRLSMESVGDKLEAKLYSLGADGSTIHANYYESDDPWLLLQLAGFDSESVTLYLSVATANAVVGELVRELKKIASDAPAEEDLADGR